MKNYRVRLVDGSFDFIEADRYYFPNDLLRFDKRVVEATLREDDIYEKVAMYKDWLSVHLADG